MSVIKITFLLAILAFIPLGSDNAFSGQLRRHKCDAWVTTFFRMSTKEQIAKFTEYDLENKFSILICGNQVIHPPATYLAGPFARQGADAVTFLRDKLMQSPDDFTVRDIVLVFSEMSKLQTYNVKADKKLIELINSKVGAIKNNDWRKISEDRVREIMEDLRFKK